MDSVEVLLRSNVMTKCKYLFGHNDDNILYQCNDVISLFETAEYHVRVKYYNVY